MEKEYNLGEKIYDENYCPDSSTHWMRVKDVKEFIRLLKETKEDCNCRSCKAWIIAIDKLAGDKLI